MPPLAAAESIEPGEDDVACHLAQMAVGDRPLQQDGTDPVEIAPDRGIVSGLGPGATVVQDAGPVFDVRRIPGVMPSSLRSSHCSNDGVPSSWKTPMSANTSTARRTLSPRDRDEA